MLKSGSFFSFWMQKSRKDDKGNLGFKKMMGADQNCCGAGRISPKYI